jgi:hypothetical protein
LCGVSGVGFVHTTTVRLPSRTKRLFSKAGFGLKSTPQERLAAMAVICQTHDDGKPESRLSRLHYAVGKKVR